MNQLIRSVGWRALQSVGGEGLTLLAFVMTSRLVPVEAFGTMAVATAVTIVLQTQVQHGLPEAMVQHQELPPVLVGAALRANLRTGALLAMVQLAIAWVLSHALSKPDLLWIMSALAPVLLLNAVSAPLMAALRRELRFDDAARRNLMATATGAVCAVLAAALGAGAWALVIQQLCTALAGLLVLLRNGRGQLVAMRQAVAVPAEMRLMARRLRMAELVGNAGRRLDVVVIGSCLTSHQLGLYFMAARLMTSASLLTHAAFSDVSHALLSRAQGDPQSHRRQALTLFSSASLWCAFVYGMLRISATELVPRIFGPQWAEALAPLQVLAAWAIFSSMSGVGVTVILSRGLSKRAAALSAATSLLQLLAVTVAAPHGLVAVAWGVGVAQALSFSVLALQLRTQLVISLRALARSLLVPMLLGMASAHLAGMLPGDASAPVASCLARSVLFMALMAGLTLALFNGAQRELFWRGLCRRIQALSGRRA